MPRVVRTYGRRWLGRSYVNKQTILLCGMTKKTITDNFKSIDTFTNDLSLKCSGSKGGTVSCPKAHQRAERECQKISPEDRAKIGQYTAWNGTSAALRHIESTGTFPSLSKSALHVWKNAYCSELPSGLREKVPVEPTKELPEMRQGDLCYLSKRWKRS